MKKILQVTLIVLITMIISVTGTVYAITYLSARDITFKPNEANFANGFNADNVEDALNQLYVKTGNLPEGCIMGSFEHNANSQYDYEFPFAPSRFYITYIYEPGKYNKEVTIYYDKEVVNKPWVFNFENNSYGSYYNYATLSGAKLTSNFPTTYLTYKNVYQMNYIACE